MSYCINPNCAHPKNATTAHQCQSCGGTLLLQDRYSVLRSLGQGGFGATFLARNITLPGKPPCVIKQLRPSAEAGQMLDMARNLFEREAKILGEIGDHPQLPRLLGYFETDQGFFLVQEFINGATLQQEVKRGGPFTEEGVKQFLSEILPIVQYLHDHQVIHRDIKPANIIRRVQDKKLVLIDFGAVKEKVNPYQVAVSDQTALTAYAVGTPGYAPPEQMAMRPVYASDIYALGATCIYLLSAKSPKDLNYHPGTANLIWRDQVQVSDHFAAVLHKMLEISVSRRYENTESVLRDLDLEPYLDSLAQNMAMSLPPSPGSTGAGRAAASPSANSDSRGGAPSSRLAAAIRARRERSSSSSRPSHLSGYGVPSSPAQPSPAKATPLSGDEIKQRYLKGRKDFSGQTLERLNVSHTAIPDINFHQSKLCRANFQNSDLSRANFGWCDLSFANLRDARLTAAYFHGANLEKADLRGANLSGASLSNARLHGTNLCGANLTRAQISDEQLAKAEVNWYTILPDGRRGLA
ncbi:MAG: pentapeptide repeat-containing protein [Cyanobacteria bacterium REEB459]|nr:pentapeptide repeat-containing protein [Cyanobacteria bacterium REEB459]